MAEIADVDYKKVLISEVGADGGLGTKWRKIQGFVRQGTASLQGSAASVTPHKNVIGGIIKSSSLLGDNNMNLQVGDISAINRAYLMGGTIETSADGTNYKAPSLAQSIYRSFMLVGRDNTIDYAVNVKVDAFFARGDNDLAYIQVNGLVETPTKEGVEPRGSWENINADANDIISFSLAEENGVATISTVTHTVAIEVALGTVVTALEPLIGVSIGADAVPFSGDAVDFTSPVIYAVESANGVKQDWTVTVTVATV